jgi:hypothetical protein
MVSATALAVLIMDLETALDDMLDRSIDGV